MGSVNNLRADHAFRFSSEEGKSHYLLLNLAVRRILVEDAAHLHILSELGYFDATMSSDRVVDHPFRLVLALHLESVSRALLGNILHSNLLLLSVKSADHGGLSCISGVRDIIFFHLRDDRAEGFSSEIGSRYYLLLVLSHINITLVEDAANLKILRESGGYFGAGLSTDGVEGHPRRLVLALHLELVSRALLGEVLDSHALHGRGGFSNDHAERS